MIFWATRDSFALQDVLYLVCSAFVLSHSFCVFAALRGGQLGYPDLPVPSTHGQCGVATVREKLCLQKQKNSYIFIIIKQKQTN